MYRIRFLVLSINLLFTFLIGSNLLQTPSAEAEGIEGVSVVANPQSYTGRCPHMVKFTGVIEVNRYPMSFNYHWERSDGAKTPVKVVQVPSPDTRSITVVQYWQLGSEGQEEEIWEKLIVNSGNTHITSGPAVARISCQ